MMMDDSQARFDGQTRYTLEINDSRVTPDVLRFRGREALNEPFRWRIEFNTPQNDVAAEDVLMKYATLSMRSGRVVQGIITGFQWLGTTADQTHYAVTLSSRLSLLSHTRRCAVYQNLSVPELVEQILRAHGLEGADFEFRLEKRYPQRELITQWRESDLQFIQRLLSETGIWFRTGVNNVTRLDTVTFADSQLNYQLDVHLPYQEPSALNDDATESVWGLRTWHNTVTGLVRTRDYNYRTATTPKDSAVTVRNNAVTTGEHYRYAAPFLDAGDDGTSEPETESGAFYARIHHERELNNSARLHLFSNASHLTPGMVLEADGSSLNDLKEGVVITLTTYSAARDSRLHVSVWGMPYSEQFCFRPPEVQRPKMPGTQPARIESREKGDIYAHLDNQGRYRVKLDFSREDAEPGYNYLWVRQAKPYAGETYGWHTPLIDGTEVGIAYGDGDIDRPYIAHAFHDSEHADIVTRDNRSQNILRTAAQNELRMEDQRGEEHIALTTPFGGTQLNQGHIVDEQNKPRGSGFELRTDEYGVIRVAKGLFITADGQQKAAGEVLDMDAALKEIDICQQQLKALAAAAEQAQALEADIASQLAMFDQRLKPLNELIHFHGPQGVAFSSGEHMQLTATQNVAINSGGDFSSGALGNTAILAGESIGLFARSGTLSLNASEGPVQIQAQNGEMHISAEQKLSLISASDMLFAGKKKVTLIGGGSYLIIQDGKIEYGTDTTYTRKIKRSVTTGSASLPVSMPMLVEPVNNPMSVMQNSNTSFAAGNSTQADDGSLIPVSASLPEDLKDAVTKAPTEDVEDNYYFHLSKGVNLESFMTKGLIPQGSVGATLSLDDRNKRIKGSVNYLYKRALGKAKTLEGAKFKIKKQFIWREGNVRISKDIWRAMMQKLNTLPMADEGNLQEFDKRLVESLDFALKHADAGWYVMHNHVVEDSLKYEDMKSAGLLDVLEKKAQRIQQREFENTKGYIYLTTNRKTMIKYLDLFKEYNELFIAVVRQELLNANNISVDDQEPDGAIKYRGSILPEHLMYVQSDLTISFTAISEKGKALLDFTKVQQFLYGK